MGYAIKKENGGREKEKEERERRGNKGVGVRERYSTCSIFYRPCFPLVKVFFSSFPIFWNERKNEGKKNLV